MSKSFAILFICFIGLVQSLPSFIPKGIRRFSNGSNFTSMLLIDRSLYIGARDNLFKLDALDIENSQSPSFVSISLPSNTEQREQCISTYYDEKLCNNFIKSIIHRPIEKDIFICGTYSFQPRLFQFTYDLTMVKEEDGYGFCSLNPTDSSTVIWIDRGNPLNIPSLYSASLLDASTKTQPVEPVIYRPELRRGEKSVPYMRTPKFDSDWLYQPVFIKSFDVDDTVLFFLKEKSLEQVAEAQDQYYARVIRVCKSDMGAVNLGNQWSSLRKTRLTCVYNNTYLNDLEDIIRVNEETFVGLFNVKLPDRNTVSFMCEFKKQDLLSNLNAPAANFKELTPGTQYWSRVSADKVPKNIPNQCNYNSQQLKDEVLNFIKSHCLIGDFVEGNFIHFVNKHVISIEVDRISANLRPESAHLYSSGSTLNTKDANDNVEINVFYMGTVDGKVIKVSNLDPKQIISEWKMCDDPIKSLKIRPGQSLYAMTDSSMYQVELAGEQCSSYYVCSLCMRDPYCGWNLRTNRCEDATASSNRAATDSLASNLVPLNPGLCARLERQENVKTVQLESGSFVLLECLLGADTRRNEFLYQHVEWRRGQRPIDFEHFSSMNIFLTANKDLIIASGNSSLNGIYNCYYDKTELISSYSVTFKQGDVTKVSKQGSSPNQKCITAESYIKQYNNWCDEYNRYHRALNEWEEMKDKTCSTSSASDRN